ncbi:MAG TPA: AarF/UbiB family protein [Mycobacteriales bacterium]|jgi:predicted unusual protein kinase regulating ubiquinone biosynthesis (AarF/ABC1/UbiB family)|nr:AarF/UbiB family protein [Mycobacteriales bacterium]
MTREPNHADSGNSQPVKVITTARHLGRYRDIGLLLLKYGRSDLIHQAGIDTTLLDDVEPEGAHAEGAELATDLERLGPTFIKLGQLLSTRADLLPAPYVDALSRLQDQLEPFPFEQVRSIVEDELGVRLSRAYDQFDETPMAAASIGQVHNAVLRGGREVVVKVQRPGIRRQVFDDLEVLEDLADRVEAHSQTGRLIGVGGLISQFRRSLLDELDYRKEASNLIRLRGIVENRTELLVPAPYEDFTTGRVLTMERIHGRKTTEISPLTRLNLDGESLARALFDAYLDQILVEGFFHADPHPGNVLLTPDNRLGLIDLGMVATGRYGSVRRSSVVPRTACVSRRRAPWAGRVRVRR